MGLGWSNAQLGTLWAAANLLVYLGACKQQVPAGMGQEGPRQSGTHAPPTLSQTTPSQVPPGSPAPYAPVQVQGQQQGVPTTPVRAPTASTVDQTSGQTTSTTSNGEPHQCGEASYYGAELNGNQTANGEIFNMNALTAAHLRLPFGTEVKVIKQRKGGPAQGQVTVRINDDGPHVGGRIIDLSEGAFKQMTQLSEGTAHVCLYIVKMGSGRR